MTAHVCGIDIGKTVFHLIGLSKEGQIVIKKRFTRKQLITHIANMPACLIGMEACPGAHFLARVLRAQGHEVKLMPAEYVRPFVKSNKNDYVDAEAIAEAVQRPTMRFVPIKSEAQLDLQALHRVRDRWMGRRTAVINQIRGFLLEHGITVAVGPAHLKRQIPFILEDADNCCRRACEHSSSSFGTSGRSWRRRLKISTGSLLKRLRKKRTADVCSPSLGSDPSQRPRLPQPSVTLRPFTKAVIWQPGSVWFRASIQQAAKQDFSALANVAIPICDGFLSTEVEPWSHA